MIALWSYKLAARWRLWSSIHFVLRAWVCNPSLSGNFLQTPELNSVGTKTDVYLILLITRQKTFQVTKKNGETIGTQNIEVRLSRIVKQPNIEKFQVCSWKKLNGQCNTFANKTIQGTKFWKTLGYFFGLVFPHTTIVSQRKQYKVSFSLIFCFASVDSFKALTGCLEKLEVLAKRFGLKKNFHQSYSKTSVPTSSLHFIYTDIKSIFDRAMAWIALIFYWFDSIYQWLTSGLTGWQRGEGGEMLINMFCVLGFETHPWRVIFYKYLNWNR